MTSNLVVPVMFPLTVANQNTFSPPWILFFTNLLSYVNSLPTGNGGTWPGFAVPNLQLSNTSANGTLNAAISANATVRIFNDANSPSPISFGSAANTGIINFSARRDHVHSVPATNSIPLDTWGNPSNITALNANTNSHGLLPQLSGNTSTFLRGDGSFAVPSSSPSLTFSDSLSNTNNTVTLLNDVASPGDSQLYGTNATGVKGWYAQPSGGGGGNAITALSGDVVANGPGNVTATIQANVVNQAKLKTATGTWSIVIPASSTSTTTVVDYCFLPKQAGDGLYISVWLPWTPSATQTFTLCAENNNDSGSETWTGTYRYVSSSEQKVEVYKNASNQIVAIHVTDSQNPSPTTQIFDANKNPVVLNLTVLNANTTPTLFDPDQTCLQDASNLMANPVLLCPTVV